MATETKDALGSKQTMLRKQAAQLCAMARLRLPHSSPAKPKPATCSIQTHLEHEFLLRPRKSAPTCALRTQNALLLRTTRRRTRASCSLHCLRRGSFPTSSGRTVNVEKVMLVALGTKAVQVLATLHRPVVAELLPAMGLLLSARFLPAASKSKSTWRTLPRT